MEAHGSVTTKWKGNILLITTHGSFNIEGINIAFDQIKETVNQKNFPVWSRVDFLDNDTLGSKEVMKVISSSYLWSFQESQCKEMVVYCSNLLQQEMLKNFLRTTPLNIKIFTDLDEIYQYIERL
ncbi:hypothetical protein [Thalassotalea profundi]|uniref:STAS domain-containing protein n=1 Tax=Thalassotalea profundi TaxID=2036687 RepID=A0ABQ3II47_9GAMM|nr:hypothetical protein [Thalassotalea profundi]GHE78973.1 hypothetical protein GCM10011501_03610 [Thalassotalea profundi]